MELVERGRKGWGEEGGRGKEGMGRRKRGQGRGGEQIGGKAEAEVKVEVEVEVEVEAEVEAQVEGDGEQRERTGRGGGYMPASSTVKNAAPFADVTRPALIDAARKVRLGPQPRKLSLAHLPHLCKLSPAHLHPGATMPSPPPC